MSVRLPLHHPAGGSPPHSWEEFRIALFITLAIFSDTRHAAGLPLFTRRSHQSFAITR